MRRATPKGFFTCQHPERPSPVALIAGHPYRIFK